MRAREADPLSAFGGIVGLNRPIDVETARALDVDVHRGGDRAGDRRTPRTCCAILATKANLRVVTASFDGLDAARDARSILGAWLVQARDRVAEAARAVAGRGDDAARRHAARADGGGVGGAAIRVARLRAREVEHGHLHRAATSTLAVGAGQMSRVDAVKTAVMKAGDRLRGSVVASDAFFPFRDGLDAVAAAGATAVVQPGGSVRDADVIAAADEHGLAMVFTGRRHFRH